jgi:succinylarginine dihydrolase
LPGPTHNYSGLSEGNLASERNRNLVADPRQAALQGLAKMKALADAGYAQAVLPPHERPAVGVLRALGFAADSDAGVIARAAREAPQLLAACSSAAARWVADAATVSPSSDPVDRRVHFTPANLVSHFHRALETPTTTRVLRAIFNDEEKFAVHESLPATAQFGDEGAANQMRFGRHPQGPGSGSSSMDVWLWTRPRRRCSAIRRGRREKRRRPLPGGMASIRAARCSRSKTRRPSMPARFTTTSSQSQTAWCFSATSMRLSRIRHFSPRCAPAWARRLHRSSYVNRR